MQNLIFLVPLFIFLYMLYKLVKDDYVFIRKGILPEQAFDTAFFACFFGLLISRVVSLLQYSFTNNLFFSFFSSKVGSLSLSGFVLGVLAVLYSIGKKRKIALGRFFDFFTLSFLPALAFGFLSSALFVRGYELIITFSYAGFYGVLTIVFFRFLKPQLLSRTLKEGSITLFFLMIFSLFSLIDTLFLQQPGKIIFFHIENLISFALFLGSIIFYFKQEGGRRR